MKKSPTKQSQSLPKAPTESADAPNVANLISRIKDSSKLSFNSGNWRLFSELYEPGTFDCWKSASGADVFGFLAMQPIPEHAKYKVEAFTEFGLANGVFSNHKPTHLLEISYKQSTDGERCGIEESKRSPTHYFS
ncbi:hypothetical protein [Microbulbifer aggregans]|uniref:hypothetical protein n=1 Tax=Microbulbifer aggregans TaxID=1769779 RepID=UPI001CFD4F17|nr:hypothetical protein [Microbulbifer aggregans]